MRINDLPVTDAELDQHYGTAPSDFEVAEEIGKASSDFDDSELGDVCATAHEIILDLIASKDAAALGNYIMFLRRQRIADIASRRIYGRVGMISEKEVRV